MVSLRHRHRVRIAALQILFEIEETDHAVDLVLERRLAIEAPAEADVAPRQRRLFYAPENADQVAELVIEQALIDEVLPDESVQFLRRLVFGVWEHRSYLDGIIEESAPNWPVTQMPGVDKATLRIALFELLVDDGRLAPVKVAINEAVELAKQFGSDNSGRFVNGVLGTVVARYRPRGDEQ